MNRKFDTKQTEVKFFLSPEEARRFDAVLAPIGGKRGPFAKALLLREIEKKQSSEVVNHERS